MTVGEYNKAVEDWSDALLRFLCKSIGDRDTAWDLVQDSFESLWKKREEVETQYVKSWLFKVGYRKMIDHIRKQKHTTDLEDIAESRASAGGSEYLGLEEVISQAVGKLPESQRTAVMLRDYEGHDYKSIAEVTGMSESQVKVNIFRARQKLKQMIGKLEAVL